MTMDAPSAVDEGGRLADDLSFLLARCSALSNAAGNAAIRALGLKVRSYSVLALACDSVRRSQREIAEFLRLDPSQVVALIDSMQSAGLIARDPDPRDRRANVIVATAPGRELFIRARRALLQTQDSHLRALSRQEQTVLRTLLQKIAFPE